MYARRVGSDVLDFGHRGWLFEESFLIYDYQTDSLWVQATGEAVHGPHRGTKLDRLPSMQTTWELWRRLHPETQVLGRAIGNDSDYWTDSYQGYYATGRGIKYRRGHALHFGLAIVLPEAQKLFPFDALAKQPAVLDDVGGTPVLVVYHDPTRTAVAFDRRLDGRKLTFGTPDAQATDVILTDAETQSTWSGLRGVGLSGPNMGRQLRQLPTTQFVVENWPLHYPTGGVYARP